MKIKNTPAIEERTTMKKELYLVCVKCKKEIKGNSVGTVLQNLRVHQMQKHSEGKE